MVKRLHMTTADYVTIALSPALIMTLVGSLVYFLIEVLYVGEYQARLMYVFALFVFAAVLVARIAIENGGDYAALFALPLGLATFFVLLKFVEHPSPFSWLINIGLMCIVWWCAHKLTWDCTLIDDEEDSSGEGLMQRMGVGDAEDARDLPVAENELLAETSDATPWWKKLFQQKKGRHTPGLWVLYFSLAALPLFGIGQHWIPAAETGRRRYVFSLLLIYVASGLALLVTTSFLGLRRYLRQRRIEMPAPMAANWVAIGAVLIVIVMLLAALIPRPDAEYAISQVPWQVTSPGGQSSSRFGAGRDGSEEPDRSGGAIKEDAPQGDAVQEDAKGDPAESDEGERAGDGGQNESEGENSSADSNDSSSSPSDGQQGEDSTDPDSDPSRDGQPGETQSTAENDEEQQEEPEEGGRTANAPLPEHADEQRPFELPQVPDMSLGILTGALKLLFYAVVAVLVAILLWRHRQALAQAVRDLVRQLRELFARLFGRTAAVNESVEEQAKPSAVRLRPFADYRDPFASGDYRRLAPEELVRYTFEAFEAWAREAGHHRTPDQTPAELVGASVSPRTPLYDHAHNMIGLYSKVAYASTSISPLSAQSLRGLWLIMNESSARVR
jgi:hypothetical protein